MAFHSIFSTKETEIPESVIPKKTLSRINSKTRRKAMKKSDFGVFSIEKFPIKISEKALMCRTSEFVFSENS